MNLFWPAVSVLGFLVLAGFDIALATASTGRQERERQSAAGVPAPEPNVAAAAPADATVAASGTLGGVAAPADGGAGPGVRRSPVGVAAHPAGRRTVELTAPTGWWLVDESDESDVSVLSGPFSDPLEAQCAALLSGLPDSTRTVYGACRADGVLVRRHSLEELAWLAELGDQLDRLGDDWDALLSDTDELTTLVVDVTAALVDAGLALHDCDAHVAPAAMAGGVCLTPVGRSGILVCWRQHDRMSLHQVRGSEVAAAVQRTMNTAVADVLTETGFTVEAFGSTGCYLVTGAVL